MIEILKEKIKYIEGSNLPSDPIENVCLFCDLMKVCSCSALLGLQNCVNRIDCISVACHPPLTLSPCVHLFNMYFVFAF